MNNNVKLLPHKLPAEAVKLALDIIKEERSGKQLGLYTQYPILNRAMGKYWRFNTVNLLAGLSGHGKSYFLTIINNNFLDTTLNTTEFTTIVFHFCFEMSAHNEILRSVAKDLGINYNYLLSSQFDKVSGEYNSITDKELDKIEKAMEYYANTNILFFDIPGNIIEIYYTILDRAKYYAKLSKATGKKYKFIVNIDHSLLIEAIGNQKALEIMSDVGKVAIKIRKTFGAMVNLLGQLNNNIEDVRRLTNPALHFPQKSDIYAQGQLYNACDNVFVIHQPALLKIIYYGTHKIPTNNLIHLIKLKARHGTVGHLWFINALHEGKIIEIVPNAVEEENKSIDNEENEVTL
jgi:replicative DNA helicase